MNKDRLVEQVDKAFSLFQRLKAAESQADRWNLWKVWSVRIEKTKRTELHERISENENVVAHLVFGLHGVSQYLRDGERIFEDELRRQLGRRPEVRNSVQRFAAEIARPTAVYERHGSGMVISQPIATAKKPNQSFDQYQEFRNRRGYRAAGLPPVGVDFTNPFTGELIPAQRAGQTSGNASDGRPERSLAGQRLDNLRDQSPEVPGVRQRIR